ncbi:MAG TPA: DUF2971 domain-containing protein [Candidatus Limisoma gallistercoris]|nr:DUF2971 domain-containing protein [Candidatus Limisoma gallistercoris]
MNIAYKYRANIEIGKNKRDTEQLSQNLLYAPDIRMLNDPFEGSVDLPKAYKHDYWVTPVIQKLYSAGIYSLSKPKSNETFPCNELLWAHYANSHKGFCIEYDLDKLSNYSSCVFDVENVIEVTYESERPSVSEVDNMSQIQKKVFGTKSLAWKYENEIRIVFEKSGEKIIPDNAIMGIYFGLRITLEDRRDIIKRLSKQNINFYQIERIENSYQLKATKLLFDYSYEVVNVKHGPFVDNYMILYKSINKDKNTLIEFIELFRDTLKYPANITVVDDMKAVPVLENYKPRKYMSAEEIEIQAKHWIAYSSFDIPKCVWFFPEDIGHSE